MCSHRALALTVVLVSCSLVGCGIVVPDIKEVWDRDYPGDITTQPPTPPISGAAQIEFEIKKRIYCDLKEAVQTANFYSETVTEGKRVVNTNSLIPPDWGAQISLSLEVDESSALNPGLTLNHVMPSAINNFGLGNTVITPQSFGLGFGGTLSSTATRIDKFDPYYSIAYLLKPVSPEGVCNKKTPDPLVEPLGEIGLTPAKSSPLIESYLGITEWLVGAMFTNESIPSVVQPPPKRPTPSELERQRVQLRKEGYTDAEVTLILASKANASQGGGQGGATQKPDTVSIEIKFVIVSNGNVTPTWKLVRVSANTGSTPFLNLGRTRTHDLIITIGPPNQATANTHLASQIGRSVSGGIQSFISTPGNNNVTSPNF